MFKGLGALGDLSNVMKQVSEMKGKIEEIKDQLAEEVVEASAGGGMVALVMNGKMEVLSVSIDPEVINREEPEMLETLVRAAMNEAVTKARDRVQERMREVTGGLNIPGLT